MTFFEENEKEFSVSMGENIKVTPLLIEDDKVSSKSAWSSKNTIEKLCPAFDEIGTIVACNPVEGYPLKVVTHNVGADVGELTLYHTGKNLWDFKKGLAWVRGGVNASSGADIYKYGYIVDLPAGTYTIHAEINDASVATGNDYIFFEFVDKDSLKFGGVHYLVVGTDCYTEQINLTDKQYLFVYDAGRNSANEVTENYAKGLFYEYANIQIEVGTKDTPYEPHHGEVKTVTLPEVHLEGTYNWNTGIYTEIGGGSSGLGTPQNIIAFPGVNYLWSSNGDTEVSGCVDPNEVIKNLTNAIISLGGNV